MKKLFTLFAFLACFLGAKAVEFVDAEVDFSKYTDISEVKFYSWQGAGRERLSIQDGCLHYHSEEATENPWDVQFFPIGGVNVELGVTYTYTLKIKGSVEGQVWNCYFAGVDKYGAFDVTTDWQEIQLTYEATKEDGDLLFQCGGYVGDFDIAWMKITHEEREQRPVQWQTILTNGDAEGEYGEPACVYSKEFGMNLNEKGEPQPHPAEITTEGDNKVFVCHAKAVNPVMYYPEDGETSWGQKFYAGDVMPDNAWQNQFWIVLPRAAKDGEQFKLSFRYKASKAVKADSQDHRLPGDYLGGGSYGQISFTTEWQKYEKEFSAAADMQSIAFNLGTEVYTEDMDFFLDDVKVEEMVLDHGLFAASTHTTSGLVDYDFDNAVEFTWDDENEAYVATVGKKGDQDSWVNEVMISTVRGHYKAFKAATLKCNAKVGEWVDYTEASGAKIKLPAAGVWNIFVDDEQMQMFFEQVEGEVVKEPLNPEDCINETEVIVNAAERAYTLDEAKAAGLLVDNDNPTDEEKALYNGQPWDNQFFLIANRTLAVDEEVYLKFEYMAETPAQVGTQNSQDAGGYLHWAGIGNLDFTSEWQTYEGTITIPSETNDKQNSWTFNLANMKGANKYHFKNFIFMTADNTENLIAKEGTENLWVKEGAGTAYEFGTDPTGINSVVNNSNVSTAAYNLAGQRVSNDYKGLVIKNGKKYIVK